MATLTQYRQFGAQEAGRFVSGTTTTGGSTSTAIVTELISSESIDDLYADYWAYFPSSTTANKMRHVKAYTASTGTLTLDRALAAAPDSLAFELHGMCRPVDDGLTELSWTALVNDALKRCYVQVEFTVTPTALATRHDLTTTKSWLTDETWVRQIGYLGTGETRANQDPYAPGRTVRGQTEKYDGHVYINHYPYSFNTNQTLYVKAISPAYYQCKPSAGAFGDQSGLSLETDEAIPDIEWAGYGALVELARRKAMVLGRDASDELAKNEVRWAAMFTERTRKKTQALPKRHFRPMVGLTISPYR